MAAAAPPLAMAEIATATAAASQPIDEALLLMTTHARQLQPCRKIRLRDDEGPRRTGPPFSISDVRASISSGAC
jgi:hypothetical protein